MPTWEVMAGSTSGRVSGATGNRYTPLAGEVQWQLADALEDRTQVQVYASYTWANLYIRITAYSLSASAPVTSRINAADGNMTVTITGTGVFQDTVNTDSVVNGDLLNWKTVFPATGTLTAAMFGSTLQDTSTNTTLAVTSSEFNQLSATTKFLPYGGSVSNAASYDTETDIQYTVRRATTYSNLRMFAEPNNLNGNTTVNLQVNTLAGNQTVTIGASTTGEVEDTTNTDAVAAGDEINYQEVTLGSAGGCTLDIVQMVHTSVGREMVAAQLAQGVAYSADRYVVAECLSRSTETTESNTQIAARAAFTAKNLFVNVKTHGATSGVDFFLRLNTANSALTVNVPASTTGLFEDTTNSANIAVTDLYNYFVDHGGGAGSITIGVMGTEQAPTDAIVDLLGNRLNVLARM